MVAPAVEPVTVVIERSRFGRRPPFLIVGLLLVGCAVCVVSWSGGGSREGQWLVGRWASSVTYSNGSTVERDWTFDADGRLLIQNRTRMAGANGKEMLQVVKGRWWIRDGVLQVKADQPFIKEFVMVIVRTGVAVWKVLTWQGHKVIDVEVNSGHLDRHSPDQFTVRWYDAFTLQETVRQDWIKIR